MAEKSRTAADGPGLSVDPGGRWQLFTATLPSGAIPLGTVTRGGDTGALVRFEKTGRYAQVTAGATRALDGRAVAAALGTGGRPAALDAGQRVNVYLDAESAAIARALGGGNVSAGIRAALKRARASGGD